MASLERPRILNDKTDENIFPFKIQAAATILLGPHFVAKPSESLGFGCPHLRQISSLDRPQLIQIPSRYLLELRSMN
jgi:hypothetical protein